MQERAKKKGEESMCVPADWQCRGSMKNDDDDDGANR